MTQVLSLSVLPILMILAALTDILSFRIPNWLTVLTAAMFFPMAWMTGMPLVEFGWHLAAGVGLFVLGFLLFTVRLFGGGDAKLMAAAGLWFGTSQTIPFLAMTAIAGGLLAILVVIWAFIAQMIQLQGTKEGSLAHAALKSIKPKLPYGFAFAIGAILVFPETWWMQAAGMQVVAGH
jgi:prepilin peptidase CpaA